MMKMNQNVKFWRKYVKRLMTERVAGGEFLARQSIHSVFLWLLMGILGIALIAWGKGRIGLEIFFNVFIGFCAVICLVLGINEITILCKYHEKRSALKCGIYMAVFMLLTAALIWGRSIIKVLGYGYCFVFIVLSIYVAIKDFIKIRGHYLRQKGKHEAGTLESDFTTWPYEIEPFAENRSFVIYLFARDALIDLSGPVYSGYLECQAGREGLDKKYLYIGNKDVPVTFSSELSALKACEEKTFPGYTDFIRQNLSLVSIPEDHLSHAELKCKMGNYIRDNLAPRYNCFLVTNDYEFKILAHSRELKVLSVEELKNRWKEKTT